MGDAAPGEWFAELVRTLPSLVRSYTGPRTLAPRTREEIILAVSEVNGCRWTAWVHGPWRDFLGDGAPDDARAAVLEYARACATAGRPLPASSLDGVLPADARRAVRATVARVELSTIVGRSVDRVLARLGQGVAFAPVTLVRDIATVLAAVPMAAPLVATAGAMRVANRLAPPMPEIRTPSREEANLLVELLAGAAPTYLANAAIRLAVLRLPFPVVIAVRTGRTSATIRIEGGAVALDNGVASDAVLVVDGEIETLLSAAAGSIVREAAAVELRGQ